MGPPGKRHTVTVEKRLEILQKLEDGVSLDDLSGEYGVSQRTIRRYKQESTSIRQLCEDPVRARLKRQRSSCYRNMEIRLNEWVLGRRMSGDILTNTLIRKKAQSLQQEFGNSSNFTASAGWLSRFKARFGIRLVNVCGDSADANKSAAKFINKLEKMCDEDFAADSIYNMHASSLMWKALPQKVCGKVKKDLVTVAFCANSTGTHKLPPLFIHKHANPKALKHCKQNLPVVYNHQQNAWVNEELFTNWYLNDFKKSIKEYRSHEQLFVGKVLLLVDNFTGDMISKHLRDDDDFKLIFFPPNTTSLIQPMDQGIIANCKKLFRHQLLQRVFQCSGGAKEFYSNYDIKDCIDFIANAWNNITPENIKNSWDKLLKRQNLSENSTVNPESFEYSIDQSWIKQEKLNQEETMEWVMECEKEESTADECIALAEKEIVPIQSECDIEEEEMDNMFYNLEKWSNAEPECIKFHAKILIDYYNQK